MQTSLLPYKTYMHMGGVRGGISPPPNLIAEEFGHHMPIFDKYITQLHD